MKLLDFYNEYSINPFFDSVIENSLKYRDKGSIFVQATSNEVIGDQVLGCEMPLLDETIKANVKGINSGIIISSINNSIIEINDMRTDENNKDFERKLKIISEAKNIVPGKLIDFKKIIE